MNTSASKPGSLRPLDKIHPHRILSIVAALSLFLIYLFPIAAGAAEPAPQISFSTMDGKTINLSDLKGSVTYVDFWATWCPPCRKSFPWMQEMHERYSDMGLKIIAVSLDNKGSLVERFLKEYPVDFIIAHDPKSTSAKAFKVQAMPSSYLIDKAGNITVTHLGFRDSDKDKLEKAMKSLLLSE